MQLVVDNHGWNKCGIVFMFHHWKLQKYIYKQTQLWSCVQSCFQSAIFTCLYCWMRTRNSKKESNNTTFCNVRGTEVRVFCMYAPLTVCWDIFPAFQKSSEDCLFGTQRVFAGVQRSAGVSSKLPGAFAFLTFFSLFWVHVVTIFFQWLNHIVTTSV